MAKPWKPRQSPEPTTLHEITRRYVATAWALARAMGVPLSEQFIHEYRESIACCFIEAGKAGVRLPPAVELPPLAAPSAPSPPPAPESADLHTGDHGGDVPVSQGHGHPEAPEEFLGNVPRNPVGGQPQEPDRAAASNGTALPTSIPADGNLPCRGMEIATLKPPQLVMLLARVANLLHAGQHEWTPLLAALQWERQRRLEAGRRPTPRAAEANGHGA
jgi:hypothetical protein